MTAYFVQSCSYLALKLFTFHKIHKIVAIVLTFPWWCGIKSINKLTDNLAKGNRLVLTSNTKIYENHSAVLQKQDGSYFWNSFYWPELWLTLLSWWLKGYMKTKRVPVSVIGDWHSLLSYFVLAVKGHFRILPILESYPLLSPYWTAQRANRRSRRNGQARP